MYNRYIPQADGTYRRNRIPEPNRTKSQQPPTNPAPPQGNETVMPGKNAPNDPPQPSTIPGFLKRLLPAGLDTGDLMIILLLLLMACDKEEQKNNALLTLALYFFL